MEVAVTYYDGKIKKTSQKWYLLLYCVSSIKEVIEQNSRNEQQCDERDGWCVVGTTDKLRDMISAMIKKVVRAQKPGKEVTSTASSLRGHVCVTVHELLSYTDKELFLSQ